MGLDVEDVLTITFVILAIIILITCIVTLIACCRKKQVSAGILHGATRSTCVTTTQNMYDNNISQQSHNAPAIPPRNKDLVPNTGMAVAPQPPPPLHPSEYYQGYVEPPWPPYPPTTRQPQPINPPTYGEDIVHNSTYPAEAPYYQKDRRDPPHYEEIIGESRQQQLSYNPYFQATTGNVEKY